MKAAEDSRENTIILHILCAFKVRLMHDSLDEFFRWDDAINAVQLERGTSAAWLTSGGTNQRALGRLSTLWLDTITLLGALKTWPSAGLTINLVWNNSAINEDSKVSNGHRYRSITCY